MQKKWKIYECPIDAEQKIENHKNRPCGEAKHCLVFTYFLAFETLIKILHRWKTSLSSRRRKINETEITNSKINCEAKQIKKVFPFFPLLGKLTAKKKQIFCVCVTLCRDLEEVKVYSCVFKHRGSSKLINFTHAYAFSFSCLW